MRPYSKKSRQVFSSLTCAGRVSRRGVSSEGRTEGSGEREVMARPESVWPRRRGHGMAAPKSSLRVGDPDGEALRGESDRETRSVYPRDHSPGDDDSD